MFLKLLKFSSIALVSIFLSKSVLAASPTPQQIKQFQSLPPAQQKALARQMGIDLNQFKQNRDTSSSDFTVPDTVPRFDDKDLNQVEETLESKYLKDKTEIKPFGYDLFANEPQSYSPNDSVGVPDDYVVGIGDSFSINTYGKNSASFELSVNRDGSVYFPDLSPLNVAGLSFQEAKLAIREHVLSQTIGLKVNVAMGALRSIRIFVLGEAYKPGAYTVSSLSTVTNAIFSSGGLSDIGSLRNIQVKRAGELVSSLDLYDLLISGDNSGDVVLKSGDVVFIPPVNKQVTVKGDIKRPAIYEVKDNETISDLLKMGGGASATAYLQKSVLERYDENSYRTLLNLDLSGSNLNELTLKDGDVLRINSTSNEFKESVLLVGAVTRPGSYQWQQSMRVSDVVQNIHSDLLKVADLNYALIIRELNEKGDIEVLQVNLGEALISTDSDHNYFLMPQDKLLVFSKYELKDVEQRTLARLAHTEDEQNLIERERLIKEFYEKSFKQELGLAPKLDENLNMSEAELAQKDFELANQDLEQLTNSEDSADDIELYSLYSRKRLLSPVILKLKEQASAGEPISVVEVAGEVKVPGVYPLSKSLTVSSLLAAAGGVKESAYLTRAELTRFDALESKASIKHIEVALKAALDNDKNEDLVLESKDRLNILAIPEWQESVKVTLRGELVFPGEYTIRRGETLFEVLERAGGFTSFASAKASVFTRASLRYKEKTQLKKLVTELRKEIATKSLSSNSTGGASYNESRLLLSDLSKVKPVGRLVVNIPALIGGDKTQNIQLEDGDTLYVPSKRQSVNVIGEINVASAHMYQADTELDEYILKSGGVKSRADEDRIYVIKSNGSVEVPQKGSWYAKADTALIIEPGDTIVVPLDSEYMDDLTLWSTATQIVYQVGVALAAISSI